MSTVESSSASSSIIPQSVSSGIESASQNVTQTLGNAKENISSSLNEFSQQSQAGIGASSEFLQSNTLVAKVVFILLVLIGFLILLALGTLLLTYLTSPPENPYIIHGMIDCNSNPFSISQDPSIKGSKYVQKSNNQSSGLEFTWSFWIYIKDLPDYEVQYRHVFNKGNMTYDTTGVATVNNAPGVYLSSVNDSDQINKLGTMHIVMDTVNELDQNNTIDIDNIPLRKWVHVALRMQNTILDVYVNGTIESRLLFNNVPKQNYDNVNIAQNGGFSGNLSNLRYFDYALNVFDLNSIVSWGPNLTVLDPAAKQSDFYYLSRNWYSYNQ